MSNQHVHEYIAKVTPIAQQVERVFGIPYPVTIAVSALETGWGRYVKGNNYFGIKGEGQSFKTHEFIQGEKVQVVDSFRKYSSLEESFLDFGRFLNQNPRYALALQEKDPERFAKALQAAGYATDPEYADKLISIIRRWGLGKPTFPDVPTSHWAYQEIKEVTSKGLLQGFPDGEFKPNQPVTRAELAVILYRLERSGS